MITAEIGIYHGQNIGKLVILEKGQASIEARIVGIDGNGTGREGALQRQDKVLSEIRSSVVTLGQKVDAAIVSTQTWNKRDVIKVLGWVCGTLIAMAAVTFAYLTYHNNFHAHEPLLSEHPTIASYTTSDSR